MNRKIVNTWQSNRISRITVVLFAIALGSLVPALHARSHELQNIYITSIPKCGTHLLMRCIELLTNKTRQKGGAAFISTGNMKLTPPVFFQKHLPFSRHASKILRKNNFKVVFIYRDPRDRAVASMHNVYRNALKKPIFGRLSQLPKPEVLKHHIERTDEFYNSFIPWKNDPICCAVKFEDLVGVNGGGSAQLQKETIIRIAGHIGVHLDDQLLNYCIDNLFGNTSTFREGKIGGWRDYFNDDHKKLMKIVAGDFLIDLGYENTMNW